MVGICVIFAALGFYGLLWTLQHRIVLFADRIEIEELLHTTVLNREEIRGWRSLKTTPPGFAFVLKDPSRRSVKMANFFNIDPELAEWIYTLPCLDSDGRRRTKQEIRNNLNFGKNYGDRMRTLAKGKRTAKILAWVTSLSCVWQFIYPRPAVLAFAAVASLPWLALGIVKRSRGLFVIDSLKEDSHPNVIWAFLMPGFALALRSSLNYHIIYSPAVTWISAGVGILLWVSALLADSAARMKRGSAVALLAFCAIYGYGLATEANGLFDNVPGATYRAHVLGKRMVRSKRTEYDLELEPWGPKRETNTVEVGPAVYEYVQSGDVAVMVMKRGALGIEWYYFLTWMREDRAGSNSPLR